MDFIDAKYINDILVRFDKVKRIKSNLYNFRCPICGDSKKNKNKARGYIYQIQSNVNYKCHNCGINISFNNFLKQIDPGLHKEYVFEKFKGKQSKTNSITKKKDIKEIIPQFISPKFKENINLPKASENEVAKIFLENRKLDPNVFYYAEKFKTWANTLKKDAFENTTKDEPRIVIPLHYNKKLVGFQGRTLGSSKIKYITIMLEDKLPKIYNLDDVNKDETVYITEGPFDSTFLSNSIALCGADGDVDKWGIHNRVWVYDNEPRNSEIVHRIEKCIELGERVVIWPHDIKHKDINEMILAGQSVQSLIESNIYSGLEAKLKFNFWKKI